MNVIITGGSGLIGSALARSLVADGHSATVLSRRPEAQRELAAAGVRLCQWDGRTPQGWEAEVEQADAIVNLAGANLAGDGALPQRWSAAFKLRLRDSRVWAAEAVNQAIEGAARRPRVLIQGSAIGAYGFSDERMLDEEAPRGTDFLAQLCLQWEQASLPAESMGLRRAVIRTGVVLARHGGALPRMAMPFRLGLGGPMGDGRQWLSWIHLDDEVGAIRHLLAEDELDGVFNLTAPAAVDNAEFSRLLAAALHRPARLRTPALPLRLALGEAADLALRGQRVVPKRLLANGYQFQHYELASALADLYPG